MSNLLKLCPLITDCPVPPPLYDQRDTDVVACFTLINKIVLKHHQQRMRGRGN
jgi:hypothetical protein